MGYMLINEMNDRSSVQTSSRLYLMDAGGSGPTPVKWLWFFAQVERAACSKLRNIPGIIQRFWY